jgi:uncharacterized protein YnzC (UPF0291/DUF896 family)
MNAKRINPNSKREKMSKLTSRAVQDQICQLRFYMDVHLSQYFIAIKENDTKVQRFHRGKLHEVRNRLIDLGYFQPM